MTRERIEDFREVVLPFVKKRLLETNYEGLGESDAEMFAKDFDEILNLAIKALKQEPTTENDLEVQKAIEIIKADSFASYSVNEILSARDLAVEALKQMATTKNDLVVDCISREQALKELKESAEHHANDSREEVLLRRDRDIIRALPSITPQEPRCKGCKWWKDSDGAYRRGVGAESQCPINRREVFEGNGYCYMFSPKADMRGEEE